MNVGSSLTVEDVASQYKLTVSAFCAQTLGLRVTAVLCGTNTFFMSKDCMLSLSIVVHLRKIYLDRPLIVLCQQSQMQQQRLQKRLPFSPLPAGEGDTD